MTSTVKRLVDAGRITPPGFLVDNIHYETVMGSVAYGVSNDSSDMDVYGFCIPPKDVVFPHLTGEISGFGSQAKRFEQYQQHHIAHNDKSYDIAIYSIVRYFQLCMENNPNMIDSLFTPQRCVLHTTSVGNLVREKRHLFLHKGCWAKFKGYAYSQLHKMAGRAPIGKRAAVVAEHAFDLKFAYHTVRLLYEAEMILGERDIDLERHREHLKSIRRGDVSQDEIERWASDKERALERLYETSSLPAGPDEPAIRALLLHCLEQHYGSLADAVSPRDALTQALREITDVVDRVRRNLT